MTPPDTTPALAWLARQRGAMEAALAELVDIDSNSHDRAGTERVAAALAAWLVPAGVACERIDAAGCGDACVARVPGSVPEAAPVLLMGHRDTVFPTGSVLQRPYRAEGDRAYGPGVADMKSGLVLLAFALLALRRMAALPFPVIGIFTADEEIGSARGRPAIEALARGARAAFNAEPARASGNVVAERGGGATFAIEVHGRAAHAGVNHEDGASAIEALARKIQALHRLTEYAAGIKTNVGLITGGQSANTIAPRADAVLDVRFARLDQRDALFARIRAIVEAVDVPGTSGRLLQRSESLPLEAAASRDLLARYRRSAARLGFTVDGEATGGCSDAGFTAALGVPTLCGIGPVGGNAHSEREYCCLDTLVPRTQALVATLATLA